MRQVLSLILVLGVLTRSAAARPDTASVATQIVAMPMGASIELRLKSKEKIRGARGAVSNTGFALVGSSAVERQIAFDDVVSVKAIATSHNRRNVLIAVGVGAAIAVTAAIVIIVIRGLGCAVSQCKAT